MPYFIAILLLQLFCIVHIIRTDTQKLWILGIVFLPLLGSLAYLILEVLPSLAGNRRMRHAKKTAVSRIDPDREVRAARERLAITDSLANQIALADALTARGKYGEAIGLYEAAASNEIASDNRLSVKYAEALLYDGKSQKALDVLDDIETPDSPRDAKRYLYVKARCLEELERTDEASDIYETLLKQSADDEIRCRYAAVLLADGHEGRARELLEEVEYSAKIMDRTLVAERADMYKWAKDELARIRTG